MIGRGPIARETDCRASGIEAPHGVPRRSAVAPAGGNFCARSPVARTSAV